MNRTLTFTVPGMPTAKQRARHYVRGNTGQVGTYTPSETRLFENLVAMCARESQQSAGVTMETVQTAVGEQKILCAGNPVMLGGAISLTIVAYFPVPVSRSKGKSKIYEGQPHTQKPDADNVLKAICDGCNSVVWNDDCRVYDKHITKRWTYDAPRTVVTVTEYLDGESQ